MKGVDPCVLPFVLDIDGSTPGSSMLGLSPCLTATRCGASGGHWVTCAGRRLNTNEMLRLQAMNPDRVTRPEGVSAGQFTKMIGNSMTVTVRQPFVCTSKQQSS
eukprot:6475829-Amphidinium_carterae.1